MTKSLFINPFTDYGFKRLFGSEPNKDLLINFLNELLKNEQGEIKNITYGKNEHLGRTAFDRKAIFDIYCETEKGEKFIVELQKSKHNFFKDRAVFYSTFPIQQQAETGDWSYELKAVYCVAILDFVFDKNDEFPHKYRHNIKLKDHDTHKIFYDKLTYIFLEMPKFNKSVDELENNFEKWMYVIKNLSRLDRVPDKLKEKIFNKLFETAKIANLSQKDLSIYQESLKTYLDLYNAFATLESDSLAKGEKVGLEKGLAIGLAEGELIGELKGTIKLARKLLQGGEDINKIMQLTGLSLEQIKGKK